MQKLQLDLAALYDTKPEALAADLAAEDATLVFEGGSHNNTFKGMAKAAQRANLGALVELAAARAAKRTSILAAHGVGPRRAEKA